ncbi:MAG: hypothetical protein V9E81_11555 [Marmoricola sp.]
MKKSLLVLLLWTTHHGPMTYSFPLGNDTCDRDRARLNAELRIAPDSARTIRSGQRLLRHLSRLVSRI